MSKFKISFGDKGLQQISDQLKKLTSIIAYSSDSLSGSSKIESSFNDYILNSENSISLGLGFLKSVDGGLNVPIVQLGYKHRFKTK